MPITSVSANDMKENLTAENTRTISEIEIIKNFKKQNNQELKTQGFSKDEIKEIRNLDPTEELLKRAQLDNKTLKNMGYSNEQIEIFKKYEHENDFQNTRQKKILQKKI